MSPRLHGLGLALLGLLLLLPLGALQTQEPDTPLPVPPPPAPLPTPPQPQGSTDYEKISPDADGPWGLPDDLLSALFAKVDRYREYSLKFTCDELARLAEYDASGSVVSERSRTYAYLLVTDPAGTSVRESRRELDRGGRPKPAEVEDTEPFPPAYAWVYLFSRFNEPYFKYRQIGERHFDGFDLVYEIQFRGGLRFTDGKDIRQWEGRALIDALSYTPLQIEAEPVDQQPRIEERYREWARSFSILGFRTRRPALGYHTWIQFRHHAEDLSFPTELRYDTFKAISPKQVIPTRASTRTYQGYRFYKPDASEQIGDFVDP